MKFGLTRAGLAMVMIASTSLLANTTDLAVVPELDLKRYTGMWHEIARLPMKHQDGCQKSTAEYSLGDSGLINVKNTCTKADGTTKEAKGLARQEDAKTSAKLKVNFVPGWLRWMGIGWANYWVIELDPQYQYAVVSEPKKQFLWILSRTQVMKKAVYDGIIERLKSKGFDLSKLIVSSEAN